MLPGLHQLHENEKFKGLAPVLLSNKIWVIAGPALPRPCVVECLLLAGSEVAYLHF